MLDPFGRTIDYLRISITDRCNERCLYCMPEGYKGWAQKADHLSADQLVAVAAAAARLGFRKFRLTGGEPLLRADFLDIARGIGALPGLHSLGVSTNGLRLAGLAPALAAAGVRSANVSLDALDPDLYRRITGGALAPVLAGIRAALAENIFVKLNCVLLRGLNDTEYRPLIRLAAELGTPLRFIELMPLTRDDVLSPANFLSVEELRARLGAESPLDPLPDYRPGHGPARYWRDRATGAHLGFIGAITTSDFCASCNKLRLTADGKLRPCLGRHGELDLKAALASATPDAALDQLLTEAVAAKPETHMFTTGYAPARPMTALGG
jgi:cyclic pyranopterin phosphate synthase